MAGLDDGDIYNDTLLSAARFAREADAARDFCSICWGPLPECPGHKGYMEMFGPPPSEQELAEYRADQAVRARGLERKTAALEVMVIAMGYDSLADFRAKNLMPDDDLAEEGCARP